MTEIKKKLAKSVGYVGKVEMIENAVNTERQALLNKLEEEVDDVRGVDVLDMKEDYGLEDGVYVRLDDIKSIIAKLKRGGE
jgi:hypothetical protein